MPRNTERAQQKLKEVNELRATGTPLADACKTVGISMGSYYLWRKGLPATNQKLMKKRKALRKAKAQPHVQEIEVSHYQPTRLVCLIGDAREIQAVIGALK